MYLLILESIGTSELILIAVIALIIFGPRKLPQMVKTVGKTMGEFRSATNEFKSTWEREAALEENLNSKKTISPAVISQKDTNSIAKGPEPAFTDAVAVITPQVKELSSEEAARIFQNKEIPKNDSIEVKSEAESSAAPAKRDWL